MVETDAEKDMSAIPAKTCTMQDVIEWYNASEQLTALKNKEMLLRKHVFDGMFSEPKEGVNSQPLPDNWVLKGKYTLNRTPDMDAFAQMAPALRDAGVILESLIEWKPSLKTSTYRDLSDEQRKMVDQCLVIKPGSPALEIVMPKRASKS